jgi:hypothetical protein
MMSAGSGLATASGSPKPVVWFVIDYPLKMTDY